MTMLALLAPQIRAATPAGPLALYQFGEGNGGLVRDQSGIGAALDLRIEDTSSTRWLPGGGLQLLKPTLIASAGAATKISEAVKASGEITIEAWIQPATTSLSGPARIVTLSSDSRSRNFTLGQESSAYDVRLRTTKTGSNGSRPSVTTASGSLTTQLTHVVYTRAASGSAALYLDGVRQVSTTVSGDVGNWDSDYRFALGNELDGDRGWLGNLYRVAIYARVLGASEIERSFAAGVQGTGALAGSDGGGTGDASTADSSAVTGATSLDAAIVADDAGITAGVPGLLALYDFSEAGSDVVRDRSGVGKALDLRIEDTSSTRWLAGGGLQLLSPTLIASPGAATKISEAVKASGEITVEAWIQPSSTGLNGPARIVTLSSGTRTRNFTLGQDNSAYDVRLRTTETSDNGNPSLTTPAGSLTTKLTHVVYTREASGRTTIYVNGVRQIRGSVSGELDNWDSGYRFALGNELGGKRPWLGALHRVAVYARALDSTEIEVRHAAGVKGGGNVAETDSGTSGADNTASGSGASSSGTDSTSSGSGAETATPPQATGSVALSWKPPATRTDGDPLALAEIAGYSLYYGVTRGSYSSAIRIDDPSTTSITVTDLPSGTYYFAVTARDTAGQESAPSAPATRVVD